MKFNGFVSCDIVVGGFYGDEGKGKIISYLTLGNQYVCTARGGVGPNAGHTISHNGQLIKVRMLPSALTNKHTKLMIGAGVLVNPDVLLNEINQYKTKERTYVDSRCGIIEEEHIIKDKSEEFFSKKIGTTGTGTGPANAQRVLRKLRLAREIDQLSEYLQDTSQLLNDSLDRKENVLLEGTQGTMLSLYHGDYPFVTSKDVTAGSICADVGIGPKRINDVIIVFKSYVTRVGEGPLQMELSSEEASKKGWIEFGSVTGRQRRSAPFDFDIAKRSIRINSANKIALTKLDILFPDCKGIRSYEKLTSDAKRFVQNIESETGIDVILIGTGPDVGDIVDRRK